jgi:hypothetical protein
MIGGSGGGVLERGSTREQASRRDSGSWSGCSIRNISCCLDSDGENRSGNIDEAYAEERDGDRAIELTCLSERSKSLPALRSSICPKTVENDNVSFMSHYGLLALERGANLTR